MSRPPSAPLGSSRLLSTLPLSQACAIEYEAAVRLGKPLILVHEANENKGGLPLQRARAAVTRLSDRMPWLH